MELGLKNEEYLTTVGDFFHAVFAISEIQVLFW